MGINFDNDALNKLAESLGDAFPEIVDVFLTETECSLDEIDVHLQNQKMAGVYAVVHKMKSSTKTFGATALVDILENIEGMPKSDIHKMLELQQNMRSEFALAKQHILDKL